jgi:translation elongation factor EF-1beta
LFRIFKKKNKSEVGLKVKTKKKETDLEKLEREIKELEKEIKKDDN